MVNNYSGNPVVIHHDASTNGTLPATLAHIYNGYQAGEEINGIGPKVGKGFKLNYQQTIRSSSAYGLSGDSLTDYPYAYMDDDGTIHYFKNTDEGMIDEDGLGLTLTKNGNEYKIIDKSKNEMHFNSNGNLYKIIDENGNQVTITYSGTNITKITDSGGQSITLNIDSSGYLSGYTDNGGISYSCEYINGFLERIKESDGKRVKFEYDSEGSLSQYKYTGHNTYKFVYTSLDLGKRVRKLMEYAESGEEGQVIRFDRAKYNTTKITTSGVDNIIDTEDDVNTIILYDNYGRPKTSYANTQEKELGATSIGFSAGQSDSDDSNIKKLNKVIKLADLSSTVNNMLVNHSGESIDKWHKSYYNGTITFELTSTENESIFGKRAFKVDVASSSSEARARFYQDVGNTYVEADTTYTASVYVKTENITKVDGTSVYGAALFIGIYGASTSEEKVSEYITGTTDEEVNDGWRRISVTFTTPSDVKYVRFSPAVKGATGIAYFDGLQLEEGSSIGNYNMIENPSFERVTSGQPNFWTMVNTTSSDKEGSEIRSGKKSFQFAATMSEKSIKQTFQIKGKEDDTYVLSGWSYGKGVTESDLIQYRIEATVQYSDSTSKTQTPAVYDCAVRGWKYVTSTFDLDDGTSAEKTPVSITVRLVVKGQPNILQFDDIQLMKKNVDVMKYDDEGNLTSSGDKKYTYNSNNEVITETDGIDTTFTYAYDSKGNIINITNDINNVSESYTYDNYGNKTSSTIKNAETSIQILTENIYDESGTYLVQSKDPDGNETRYVYETSKELLMSTTDADNNTTNYGYDAKDRLTSVIRDNRKNYITYDSYDKSIKQISSNTTDYNYIYDCFGNLINEKIGDTIESTNTYKNYNGDLERVTLSDGTTYEYEYDEYGNTISIKRNSSLIQSSQYDKEGNLHSTIDHIHNIKTKYDQDLSGNVIRVDRYDTTVSGLNDAWLYGMEYGYDEHDRIIKKNTKTSSGSTSTIITYKEGSYIDTYSIDSSKEMTYGYDGLNRVDSKTIDTTNPINIAYTYADSQRGNDYTTSKIETETIGNKTYTYGYDSIGNITSINDGTSTITYVYDSNSQLIKENNQILNKTITYSYDNGGNITSKKEYSYTTQEPSNPTSTITYGYGNDNWKDQLTSYNGQSINYDSLGNPLSYRGSTLTWNGRELTGITTSSNSIIYSYDANGTRISKSVNDQQTNYKYLDGKLIEEDGPDGKLCYTYDDKGNLTKIRHITTTSTTDHYIITNSRGDVDSIYDSNGNLEARYAYDSWGKTISIKDASGYEITSISHIGNINPIRYRGYYLDKETNFYYLGSRYYDSEVSRFISSDDIGVISLDNTSLYDKNLYAYCDNNPVNKFDVNGYWGFTIAGAFVGGILNASLTVFTNYLAGNNLTDGIAGAIVSGAISGAISTCPLLRSINGHKLGRIGSAIGAVAGTVVEEVLPYINGKDITKENLIESGKSIVGNGIRNVITDVTLGELAGDIVPTNNWWFRPKKLKSILIGNYSMKVLRQSLVNTFYSFIPSGIEAYYGNQ